MMSSFLKFIIDATRLAPFYYILAAVPAFAVYVLGHKRLLKSQIPSMFYAVLVFMFIAFICTFFFTPDPTLQLTVYVHGPNGRQQIILSNTGRLIVDFGNDRRVATIGENGRTNFGEIPGKFRNRPISLGLDAPGYQVVAGQLPDSITGEPVYLEVTQDASLGYVSGIIKNQNGKKFVANALVLIGNDTAVTTDSLGIFKVTLPPHMRVQDEFSPYILTVKKDGYLPLTEYYHPRSTPIEIRLQESSHSK